jgi:hypothetical protein
MNYITTLLVAVLYGVSHLTLSNEITLLISITSGYYFHGYMEESSCIKQIICVFHF